MLTLIIYAHLALLLFILYGNWIRGLGEDDSNFENYVDDEGF